MPSSGSVPPLPPAPRRSLRHAMQSCLCPFSMYLLAWPGASWRWAQGGGGMGQSRGTVSLQGG